MPARTLDEIVCRVAAHQDTARDARADFRYKQEIRLRALRGNGTLSREEFCVFNVSPKKDSVDKKLLHFEGRYLHKDGASFYSVPGEAIPNRLVDIDANVLPALREGLMNERYSRDGLAKTVFPLSTAEMPKYEFSFQGEQLYRNRQVHRITFRPRKDFEGFEESNTVWAGQVLVEKSDLQPLLIATAIAKDLPFFVRTVAGTEIHQLAFTVNYAQVDHDVYFPMNYIAECQLKAAFVYKRAFTVSMENSDYQRVEGPSAVRPVLAAPGRRR